MVDQGGRREMREDEIEALLRDVPKGAFAVSGIAVALLMACWLAIYLFVFLPRGTVG